MARTFAAAQRTPGLIEAWELEPGMIVRNWYRSLNKAGRPTYLILRAGPGLGIRAGSGIGYLFRNPAEDPSGFIGWGSALGDVQFRLDKTVDLADPALGIDPSVTESDFPSTPTALSKETE
ncbi:hypothetical protein AB0B89_36315 [Sphaerisporangium sp. NPDC049002]|uniref:hypothetical protein n=1 Tax=Sphaerisporangium sp. NPDC049002 TaxID=3155392 RepID=UPI0033F75F93